MVDTPLLELKGISKRFGGVKALTEVNLSIKEGEVHALLGENGAGKSTLMKILSGGYSCDSGTILINGKEVKIDSPVQAQKMGVGIIYQEFSLVPHMTVAENLFLAREKTSKGGFLKIREMNRLASEYLERLHVKIDPTEQVNNLSIAEKQFVEIAKALTLEIRVLILDEPSATLTPVEVEQLFKLMKDLKKEGVSMIFISHHLDEIFDIADRVSVLRDGNYIGTKKVDETDHNDLVHMMVGRSVSQEYPPKTTDTSSIRDYALRVKGLKRDSHSQEVNFDLYKGEILGIAGLVGAGRTEMIRALLGVDHTFHKEVEVFGKSQKLKSPTESLSCGIGLLPEDRKSQGVILPFSVEHNTTLCTLKKICNPLGTINNLKSRTLVEKLVKDLNIKTPDIWQSVGNLSGGNQQKVVIAKWLNSDSRIIIFDEPTRGIDVVAKSEIYKLMRELTAKGISIIMISSELPEIVGMSDRVLVMRNDSIVDELSGEKITPHNIMTLAAGGKI